MFRTQLLLKNRERPLQQRFGIGKSALILIHHGNIIETLRRLAVVCAKHLLTNLFGALMEGLGLCVEPLQTIEFAQVRQARSRLGMSRSIHTFPNREGFLKERFRSRISAQLAIHLTQLAQGFGQAFACGSRTSASLRAATNDSSACV